MQGSDFKFRVPEPVWALPTTITTSSIKPVDSEVEVEVPKSTAMTGAIEGEAPGEDDEPPKAKCSRVDSSPVDGK